MKSYKSYSDAGHGWLAVKIVELLELNILTRISSYSYMKGKTAYLEEDCDVSLFFEVYRDKHGEYPKIGHNSYNERSPIRSYDRYNMNKALDIALVSFRSKKV